MGGDGLSRRGFLGGAGALGLRLLGGPSTPAAPAPAPVTRSLASGVATSHAVGDPRGSAVVARFGRSVEARFGTMFRGLAPFEPADALLTDLAGRMVEARPPRDDILPDPLDNPAMPSGFIYLGQFIDHDITLDTTPLTLRREDPDALINFDTPSFDLGAVYGGGPERDPLLYDGDRKHLRLEINLHGLRDLPRLPDGTALIADPRNDENLIVSQLHQAFIMLHNHFLEHDAAGDFEVARRLTRWHFQWVIVHDFLPHVVGQPLLDAMVTTTDGRPHAQRLFYQPADARRPMMPVEFSAAAYRWGHSGIRPEYEMRESPTLSPNPCVLPIFNGDPDPLHSRDLRGSRPLFPDAVIDWNYFFDIPGLDAPDDRNYARRIDTQVARPLMSLPDSVIAHVPGAILALAERNLLRGKRLGLPAGQDVAAAMRHALPTLPPPLTNAQLGLTDPGWGGKAPLWFYVLKEAELGGGTMLGPVGGRIVAEVILGLLALDRTSYWHAAQPFTPVGGPGFRMGDLLLLANAPVRKPVLDLPAPPQGIRFSVFPGAIIAPR